MSRADVEHMLDALGWGWSTPLSLLLDSAVLDEEEART
jgi:hypothetical protein